MAGLLIALLCMQAGCYFRPALVRVTHPECHVVTQRLTPKLEQRRAVLADESSCADEACQSTATVNAVSSIVLLPVSAVLTGVTVLVGNGVLWVDKQVACRRAPPEPSPRAVDAPVQADPPDRDHAARE